MQLLDTFRDGGIWMVPVLGSATLLVTAWLGWAAAALLKVRMPTGAWLALVLLPLVPGAAGLWFGLREASMASVTAPPEMQATLAAAGLSLALLPLLAALFIGQGALSLGAMVIGVSAWVRRSETREASWAHAAAPVAAGALAALVALALVGGVTTAAVLGGTVGLGLASAWQDPEGTGALESTRARAGVVATMGAVLAALMAAGWSTAEQYRALATAPPEVRDALVAANDPTWPLVGFGVVSVLMVGATVAALVPVAGRLLTPRTGIGAALGTVVTLAVAFVLVAPAGSLFGLAADAVPRPLRDDLPSAQVRYPPEGFADLVVGIGPDGVELGGATLPPLDHMTRSDGRHPELAEAARKAVEAERYRFVDGEAVLVVEAPGDLSASAFAPALRALATVPDVQVQLRVIDPEHGARRLPLPLQAPPLQGPSAVVILWVDPEGWRFVDGSSPDLDPALRVPVPSGTLLQPAAVEQAARSLLDDGRLDRLVVRPHPDAGLQAVAATLATLRAVDRFGFGTVLDLEPAATAL